MHLKFSEYFWHRIHNAQTCKLWHILHVHFLFGMSGLTALPESFGLLEVLQGSCLLYFVGLILLVKPKYIRHGKDHFSWAISTMQVWVYLTTSLYPCQKASVHPARFASATQELIWWMIHTPGLQLHRNCQVNCSFYRNWIFPTTGGNSKVAAG